MKIQNYWLRFGCFLTGYRYDIIKGCSELSVKRVKRFTSAVLIIAMLWAFIGYAFTARYLKADWLIAVLGGMTTLFVVIHIERIIILSPKTNKAPMLARGLIGLAMALIGSVIIDQIIFKEDIEKEKLFADQAKADSLLNDRAKLIRSQIIDLDSALRLKEMERQVLGNEISRRPKITVYERNVRTETVPGDSLAREVVTTSAKQEDNPKIAQLNAVDQQIEKLHAQKIAKEETLVDLRAIVEKDIAAHTGFLDELQVLIRILAGSPLALSVWTLWFIILIGLESLVLVGKLGEKETDYDARLTQQMQLHYRRIDLLGKQ